MKVRSHSNVRLHMDHKTSETANFYKNQINRRPNEFFSSPDRDCNFFSHRYFVYVSIVNQYISDARSKWSSVYFSPEMFGQSWQWSSLLLN